MDEDLLLGLSDAQVEAVTTSDAPVAVIAGPGAGKTRVLTRRVSWRCADGRANPARTLVLTFSHRAAAEVAGRLSRSGVPIGARAGGVVAGTFHAVAWMTLARHRADAGRPPPAVTARPGRLAVAALTEAQGHEPWPGEPSELLREIGWARARDLGPDGYLRSGRRAGLAPDLVVAGWAAYERVKHSRGVLDLDDLLHRCVELLEGDAPALAAARWRHRHLYVDEYQDLNAVHHRLLRAWVGGRSDLCLVGDPDQSVYGFNGAVADLFDRVTADWPGVRIVRLDDNFRSTPEVVALAEAVRPGAGGPASGSPRSRRPPGPLPVLRAHRDEEAEAEAVAAAITGRSTPTPSRRRTAVLARTNARLRVVAAALERAGVPWQLRDPRPLADRPQVREWLAALPASAPVADLAAIVDASGRRAETAPVLTAVGEYRLTVPRPTVGGFATWLDATGTTAEEAAGDGVELVTFHRAKGLEWPSVWVVGVEEGLVPLASATGGAELAEERRLLYVALTRATDEVTVSWSTTGASPSRWLPALDAAAAALASRPDAREQRARLLALRRAVPGGDGALPALAARRRALAGWRARRAVAARVPPAVIVPDRALERIATAGPATEAELIAAAGPDGRRLAPWAPEVLAALATAGGAPGAVSLAG